jgi:hypothetical protein
LFIIVNGITNNTGTTEILFQPNSITDIVTSMNGAKNDAGSPLYFTGSEINAKIRLCRNGAGFANTNNNNEIVITIFDYASSVNKVITLQSAHIPYTTSEKTIINSTSAIFNTSAITSVNFSNTNGYTYSAGTVYIYGVS